MTCVRPLNTTGMAKGQLLESLEEKNCAMQFLIKWKVRLNLQKQTKESANETPSSVCLHCVTHLTPLCQKRDDWDLVCIPGFEVIW